MTYLTATQFTRLNDVCVPVRAAFGHGPYLVGSATEHAGFRDVDLRVIMPDDEFDALFAGRAMVWSITCQAISHMLADWSGLPIDFQIQRMTEANEKYPDGPRHPMGLRGRPYAGGGDATRFGGAA